MERREFLKRASVGAAAAVVAVGFAPPLQAIAQAASIALSTREPLPPFAGELRPLLLAKMQELSVPGAIVYVNAPGQGAWTTSLGTRSLAATAGAPMQVSSYMRVGSITKTFTATLILQLLDRHELGLDDPVSKHLSDVPNRMHNVTIRELLNMTSGLFDYTEDLGFEKRALWGNDPFKVWTPKELLAIASKHALYFPPGQGWHYDNTNYILLGLIIERRTHLSLEQAFQRYLFEPLDMDQTSVPSFTSAAIPDPHPRGYSLLLPGRTQPADATDWNPSWGWAAGSVISTLHDLRILAKALATGQLLSAKTQQERLEWVPQSSPLTYGLGIMETLGGFLGHTGQIPGFQSSMFYRPKDGATMIELVNLDQAPNGGAWPADALAFVIYQALFA